VPTSRAFAFTAALARATTFLVFGLIVLGSIVRTTGSGLACPDWPLCEGRIIPRLEFHVLVEWSHRTVALLVSLMLLATALSVLTRRAVRAALGGLIGLAIALLFAQVMLGALTVWKLLSPSVVSVHLAVAMLLFVTLLTIALRAQTHADDEAAVEDASPPARVAAHPAAPPGLLAGFAGASILTYFQILLGGVVSSTGAVTACPEWPTCQGQWFPPIQGLVGIHMLHRFGGYAVALVVLGVAIAARHATLEVRLAARLALTLVAAQIALGVSTVLLQAPPWVSAMHLATAEGLLAVLVIATYRLASSSAPVARLVSAAEQS